ncbi:MFS transporter [Pseudonocardia acaciae]|uniref:MFS transporter n=1 Tax=Pseudonocardia acaciae TaxID=551276 RepID=UPI0006841271|nr:MFS transporter [Pseudonocardia acaciae]
MGTTDTVPGRRGLSRPVAVAFVGYTFGVAMLGSTLPTPLYGLYQRQLGFSNLTTTVIYAVYAAGVLAALLLFGRASDVLGRRRVLLVGLAAAALSALVFTTDGGLATLLAGRVLSGLSAGLVSGTGTVALVELIELGGDGHGGRHARATMLATAVNMFGLGAGPLLAGLLAEYAPAPLLLPFVTHLLLLVPAAIGVWLAPETAPARDSGHGTRDGGRGSRGEWARPQRLGVPGQARAAFLPCAIAVFAAFAVFGLVTAVEPGFLSSLLGLPNRALAGAMVFSMFAGSVLGQAGSTRLPTRVALPTGCLVLVAGLAGIAVALTAGSLAPLAAGTVVVGVGQGVCFRAGMTAVTSASPPDRRAETVSSFFVVIYLGISVPVVLVGVGAQVWGLRTAGIVFTAAVAALALTALAIVLRLTARRAATPAAL